MVPTSRELSKPFGRVHGLTVFSRGTAGGSQFGVAKAVSLIAVKVLDDSGYVDFVPNLFCNSLKFPVAPAMSPICMSTPRHELLDYPNRYLASPD